MKETATEQARIAAVYEAYRAAGHATGKWSPSNPGNAAILRERMSALVEMLGRAGIHPLQDMNILEIGCGDGQVIGELLQIGASPARITGLDLLEERIAVARASHPDIRFLCGDASRLDIPDRSVDLVVVFTVFSSILDSDLRLSIAREAERVLRPGGAVGWYDFMRNNPSNPNVRGMGKAEIARLFPGFRIALSRVTLAPPIARHLGALTRVAYPLLASLPLLRTHYVGVLVKGSRE